MSVAPSRDIRQVSLLWAAPEHAQDIAHVHAALFETAWSAESVMKSLEHPGATALVATTGFPKVLVGFVMAQLAADEAEILSIGVASDWQRSGLGLKLMEGLVRALNKAQAKRVHLEVAADNAGAKALYAKLGFKETGRRKGYYARKGGAATDALALSKSL
jgi:[ribosomal protein S18]-alanine N-acetyltransferase